MGSFPDDESGDERDVIALAVERATPIAVGMRAVEIDPLHVRAGEEVVEMHAQAEESGGGEFAGCAFDLAERPLHADEARLLGEIPVDGRAGRRLMKLARVRASWS